jgi:hypothetical protein
MDKERLYQALRNADAAGDTQAATRLAQYIREVDAGEAAKAEMAATPATAPQKSFMQNVGGVVDNVVAGGLRGAGSIGATLMTPLDKIAQNQTGRAILRNVPVLGSLVQADDLMGQGTIIGRDNRRTAMDDANRQLGADPDSLMYKGAKLGSEIAGTSGIGGVLAKGAMAVPQLARFAPALQSGGFTLGNAATGSRLANAAIRTGAGATVGGATAGAVNPDDALKGAAIGGALPPVIKGVGALGGAIRGRMTGAPSAMTAQKLAAAQQGAAAGYVVPPADLNPGFATELVSGLSGKIKTAQVASQRNQTVTDRLAKKALGLGADDAINIDVLQGIRNQAAQAYDPVRRAGVVTSDDVFLKSLDSIAQKYQGANKAFPGLAKNEVGDMVNSLKVGQFDADGAVDAIKVLRESADKAFRTGDTGMGKAAKDAAGALESQLERHLSAGGNDDALNALRDARQLIAKTYSVQKGLNAETGSVSAQALAKQLEKGKPLSGDILTIAKMGLAFPKATQALKETPKAISPLDWFAGSGASIATSNPLPMMGLLARPAARSYLLSPTAQRAALRTPAATANPESMGLLSSSFYRAAPLLGAGLLRPDQ